MVLSHSATYSRLLDELLGSVAHLALPLSCGIRLSVACHSLSVAFVARRLPDVAHAHHVGHMAAAR